VKFRKAKLAEEGRLQRLAAREGASIRDQKAAAPRSGSDSYRPKTRDADESSGKIQQLQKNFVTAAMMGRKPNKGKAVKSLAGKRKEKKAAGIKKAKSNKKKTSKRREEAPGPLANIGEDSDRPDDEVPAQEATDETEPNHNQEQQEKFEALLVDIAKASTTVDANALRRARDTFSRTGPLVTVGDGLYRQRGMQSHLKDFQVQGAAWMISRERGDSQPRGGILADEMGMGKTVQSISVMVENQKAEEDTEDGAHCRSTLIVCPSALTSQWRAEVEKHTLRSPELGHCIEHRSGHYLRSNGTLDIMGNTFCVITTYSDLRRSYTMTQPPPKLFTEEQIQNLYAENHRNIGILHSIGWHRIVLDECTAIKNHRSVTARAALALSSKFCWLLSGTPLENHVSEVYSYLSLLKTPMLGDFAMFKKHYIEDERGLDRLQSLLSGIMLRRTHDDQYLGRQILTLQPSRTKTLFLEFSPLENAIYSIVRRSIIQHVNGILKNTDRANHQYRSVFGVLLRYRQLTGSFLQCEPMMKRIFKPEDLKEMAALSPSEKDVKDYHIFKSIQEMLNDKSLDDEQETPDDGSRENLGRAFGRRPARASTYVNWIRQSQKIQAASERAGTQTTCKLCHDVAQDAFVLHPCRDTFCYLCIKSYDEEATHGAGDCPECGCLFTSCEPVDKVGNGNPAVDLVPPESKQGTREVHRWSQKHRWQWIWKHFMPSTKLLAVKAQILEWNRQAERRKLPRPKIVIFSQFSDLLIALAVLCEREKFGGKTPGYIAFHGAYKQDVRMQNLEKWATDPNTPILLASLQSGGVGLNLTAASHAISMDLYWNSAIEAQAFARINRMGQDKATSILRLCVMHTIDEELLQRQVEKGNQIEAILKGPATVRDVRDLLALFGTVAYDDDNKPFVIPDHDSYVHPRGSDRARAFRGTREDDG
jgi:SNF2 family DNA or RNA helicase